jgi:hypothetical protein
MGLNVHPLNLCDGWGETFQAANADIRAGVAEDVEPAAWRVELGAIVEIGTDHRIYIKGQTVVRCGGVCNPSQVLGDQALGCFACLRILNCAEFNGAGSIHVIPVTPGVRHERRPEAAAA